MAKKNQQKKKSRKGSSKQNNNRQAGGVKTTIVAQRAFVGSMTSTPRMKSSGNGIVVCNTESLFTLRSSSLADGTYVNVFDIIPASFPWLDGISSSFSKYRFIRLRLFYLPTTNTSVSGRLALSLTYDTADNAPTSVGQIIAGNRATFGPVWAGQSGFDSSNPFGRSDMIHLDVDTLKFDKRYYPYTTVSNFNGMSEIDKNIYCPVQVISGVDGVPQLSLQVGQVYASYEVELIDPVSATVNA